MLATFSDEFFMKDATFLLLMEMMTCFLDGPFIVILIQGFCLFWPLTMLFTWSIFWAFSEGNVSLIFKTSDVFVKCLIAWAYDFPDLLLDSWVLFPTEWFLGWKYLEMTLISFFNLASSGGRGGALLMVTGTDFGVSLLALFLVGGILGVNFDEILDLSVLVFWSV